MSPYRRPTQDMAAIIPHVCNRLMPVRRKGDLAAMIAREVIGYSLHDLQELRGVIEYENRHLPPRYREQLRPKMIEQVFGMHHRLLSMHQRNVFARMNGELPADLHEYWAMVMKACEDRNAGKHPRFVLFYYLIAAFTMFVCEEPGHPVGTPFPGGFRVELKNRVIYCPIRDKEGDVEFSICPYCPAIQTEGV